MVPRDPGRASADRTRCARRGWERGVRLISVERPGIGASTPHTYGAVVEFADDVRQLTEGLGIERFAVAGLSGGGPYALGCAHEMSDRVVAAAVLGGVAPVVGPEAAPGGVASITPTVGPVLRALARPLGISMRGFVRLVTPVADRATFLFARLMPPGDRRVFEDPAVRWMFQEDIILGSRTNMEAFLHDIALFGRPWGFEVRNVRVPVHLFYGDADNIVPLQHGEHLARILPNARLVIRPEEGHLGGLGATHEIFEALLREGFNGKRKRVGRRRPQRVGARRSRLPPSS